MANVVWLQSAGSPDPRKCLPGLVHEWSEMGGGIEPGFGIFHSDKCDACGAVRNIKGLRSERTLEDQRQRAYAKAVRQLGEMVDADDAQCEEHNKRTLEWRVMREKRATSFAAEYVTTTSAPKPEYYLDGVRITKRVKRLSTHEGWIEIEDDSVPRRRGRVEVVKPDGSVDRESAWRERAERGRR